MSALHTRKRLLAVYCALTLGSFPFHAQAGTVSGPQVEAFTGAHTRVVWVVDEKNRDSSALGDQLTLLGFDSRDGRGERVILGEPGNYHTPMLTPEGERIVFSNRITNEIQVVNWDGTDRRVLRAGGASDLWTDADGRVWVYGQEQNGNPNSPVIRFPLDDPSTTEMVWSATPVQTLSAGAFQVSRDGKRAAGTFPWPNSGVAELPNVAWRKHRDGCWPSMAPDNSYLSWTFDGPHRNLFMTRPGEERTWKVPVSTAPGVDGYEVYHPRWSNHVRFLAMTGPYRMGEKKIKIGSGADGVEIHLGKFDKDFTAVESWLKLTDSTRGEFFPDVWIAGGEQAVSQFHQETHGEEKAPGWGWDLFSFFRKKTEFTDTWPVSDKGLVFLWENNQSANQFESTLGGRRSARLTARGGARWGPNGEMHIVQGGFVPDDSFAGEIREACKTTDQLAIEAVVTPARSPQGGPARIISFSKSIRKRNFTLGQEGDRLVLRLQTSETNRNGLDFNLAPLEAGRAHHVLVTYRPGRLVCYVDGRVASDTAFESGTFEDWKEYELLFGKELGGNRHWDGYLENVAIFNRFIEPEEAERKYQAVSAKIAGRSPIPVRVVQAEMLTKDDAPPAADIAPYLRALAVNRYRIVESDDPALTGQTVQVAEWALLDAEVPAGYAAAQPGGLRTLELQPYDNHPQLESERLISDLPSLDEELFYDVTSGR